METGKEVLILNLDDVLPNRFQPRIKFNEQSILELAESIKEHGVIQPIVVRKIADKYEIIAGERRYKASVLAGKTTIPAIVTDLDDKNSAEVALIENVQRQDLTPIEEAISYKKILDMGYLNQASLAEKLGKTQSTIANKLRLLNLDDEVQEALLGEKISERHARSLLKLEKSEQVKMLNRILTERMTVRKTDEEIMKLFGRKKEEKPIENNEMNVGGVQPIPSNENGMPAMEPNMGAPIENINTVEPPVVNMQPMTPPVAPQVEPPIAELVKPQPTENAVVHPGFMDIDKIESQAQDLFVQQPEPVKEEPPVVPLEPVPPVVPVQTEESEESGGNRPTTGRFFNMFSREEDNNPNFVSDVEEKEVNMNMNQPQPEVNPIFNFNPTSSANPQPVTPIEPSVPTPSPVMQTTEPITPQPFVAQPNIVEPNMNVASPSEVESPVEKEETFETIRPYALTDDSEFTGPVVAPAEIVEPNRQPMSSTPVELQPIREEQVEQNVVTADMKSVINTVRECVSTIESYGYVVDEDEIDLENSYQITITIDKR